MISTEEKKENHAYFHKAYGLNEGQFREREVKRFYIQKNKLNNIATTSPIYASTGNSPRLFDANSVQSRLFTAWQILMEFLPRLEESLIK